MRGSALSAERAGRGGEAEIVSLGEEGRAGGNGELVYGSLGRAPRWLSPACCRLLPRARRPIAGAPPASATASIPYCSMPSPARSRRSMPGHQPQPRRQPRHRPDADQQHALRPTSRARASRASACWTSPAVDRRGASILSGFIRRHGCTWRAVGAYNAGSASDREAARTRYVERVWPLYLELAGEREATPSGGWLTWVANTGSGCCGGTRSASVPRRQQATPPSRRSAPMRAWS